MPDKSAIAKQYVGEGDKMANKGEHDQAIRSYGIALQMTENQNPHAFARRASAFIEVQKFDSAIQDAGSAIAQDPDNVEAFRARGRAHFCSDDLEAALADFEKVLELMPNDPEAEEDLDRCKRYMEPDSEDELSDYEPQDQVEDEPDLGGFQEEVQTDDVLYGDGEEGLELDAVAAEGSDDDVVVDYGDAEDGDGGDDGLYGDAEDEGGAPSRPPPVPPPAGGDADLYGDDPDFYGDAEADEAAEAPPPVVSRKPPPTPPKEPEQPPSLPPPMPERNAAPPPEPERPPMRPPAEKQPSVRRPPPQPARAPPQQAAQSSSPQRPAVRSSFKGGPSKKLSKEPDFSPQNLATKRFCDLVHSEYSRTKAEAKLMHNTAGQQDKWANGTCIIRSSSNLPGGLVVSMLFGGRCQHFQFAKSAGGSYINPKQKEVGKNIAEFIAYYRRRKDGMPSRLERLLLPSGAK